MPTRLDTVGDRAAQHHFKDKWDGSEQLAPFANSLINHGVVCPVILAKHMLRLAEDTLAAGDTSQALCFVDVAYDLFDKAYYGAV